MVNGSSLFAAPARSTPLNSIPRSSIPKAFRGRLTGASRTMALICSHKPQRPALQKYKVKSLDLLFVTVTDSFLRKLSGKNSNFSETKYENSSSNHQKSCVYTCSHPGSGSSCPSRGSIAISGGIAASCCSADWSPATSNSKILHSRRL